MLDESHMKKFLEKFGNNTLKRLLNTLQKAKNQFYLKIFLLLFFHVLLLAIIASFRGIDRDEGYYLTASKLVYHGMAVYSDFFYPQAPLLPYFYGTYLKIVGYSFFNGRLLSVFCSLILGVLIVYCVYNRTKNENLALIILFLYSFNSSILAWHTVVKTYAISSLFVFIAYLALTTKSESERFQFQNNYMPVLVSGLLLGLAFNIRLIFISLIPLMILWIIYITKNSSPLIKIKKLIALLAGLAIPLSVLFYLYLKSPSTFLFNNLYYHTAGNSSIISSIFQKGYTSHILLSAPHFLILSLLFVVSILY